VTSQTARINRNTQPQRIIQRKIEKARKREREREREREGGEREG